MRATKAGARCGGKRSATPGNNAHNLSAFALKGHRKSAQGWPSLSGLPWVREPKIIPPLPLGEGRGVRAHLILDDSRHQLRYRCPCAIPPSAGRVSSRAAQIRAATVRKRSTKYRMRTRTPGSHESVRNMPISVLRQPGLGVYCAHVARGRRTDFGYVGMTPRNGPKASDRRGK